MSRWNARSTPPATTQDAPITVSLDPDPRGVSVGVWQGSHCIYNGAHAVPAPAAGDARKPDFARAEQIAADFVQDYEWRGEDVAGRDTCYTPNKRERAMITDAILGLLAEPEFVAALAAQVPQQDKREA
ncbi:hypothetical protein RA224_21865 [Achromobacter aegrifaciens]|uniref:hypothetical protein n=1 Tax=Achromobacter aegrifaciens TaxID=1287736 RepID=UPI0027B97CA8|nr:hypothetical protein [Achromobacter aegrifaciens]WLW59866.1 hypothetical protein RA224_21865 [Achromobacter aegrifaciens]